MNRLRSLVLAAITFAIFSAPGPAHADDTVIIGTDWRAEAEHGGLYQALATGIYARHGLQVEIRQGGPNLNQAQLLAAGRYTFSIQSNSFEILNFIKNDVPIVAVAAAFQKDPQVLIAHPGMGNDSLEAMRGKPILISAASRDNFWQFLKARYGFVDDQIRPYTFNLAPFLADKRAIMQGYVTSEPFAIEQATGEKPVTILLADQGYPSYAAMIATTAKTIAEHPDLVRRFVAASMEGWKSYLEDDPGPANALIMKDNPEMNATLLGHARDGIKTHHLVDGGAAATKGLGAMTEAQWRGFFDFTTRAGLYPATMDVHRGYDLRFVAAPKPD